VAARNIDVVLGGPADAMRSRDPERIAEFLVPDLVWEGLEPGLRCNGRQQAMSLIRDRFAAATDRPCRRSDRGRAARDPGPARAGIQRDAGDLETVGQIFNVFTLSEGKVSAGVTF
jgi:hypothetical protein